MANVLGHKQRADYQEGPSEKGHWSCVLIGMLHQQCIYLVRAILINPLPGIVQACYVLCFIHSLQP